MDGVLDVQPRPGARHAQATSALAGELDPPFRRGKGGPGGWILLYEPELHLGPDILVPDYAGWRRERMPTLPDAAFFTLAPDWVSEVLSPSTARLDRVQKLPIYAREHVGHAWLIDPRAQTLEVFARRDEGWLLRGTFAGDASVRAVRRRAARPRVTVGRHRPHRRVIVASDPRRRDGPPGSEGLDGARSSGTGSPAGPGAPQRASRRGSRRAASGEVA